MLTMVSLFGGEADCIVTINQNSHQPALALEQGTLKPTAVLDISPYLLDHGGA